MYTTKNYPAKTLTSVFDELFNSFPNAPLKPMVTSGVPVNIHESEQGYHLELNAPGRTKEAFAIKLEQNILTISAEAKAEETNNYKTVRREFAASDFKRSFTLDDKINDEGIQAKYENGILKVFLPKKEEVKITPKQINIS